MLALKKIIDRVSLLPKQNKFGPIGLHLTVEKMHLVQMYSDADGKAHYLAKTSLAYTGSRDNLLDSPKKFKAMVQTALKDKRFSGREVVTVIPATEVKIISVSYQINKGQNEDEALLKLMETRIKGELSDYVIDYLPVRGNTEGDERLAIIAYAERQRVITYLEAIRKAGLIVSEMEIGPSAIKRFICSISTIEQNENVLVINFGCAKSYMTLISGRRLLFDQEIDFGEEILLKKLSSLLDVSLEMAKDLIYKHGLYSSDEGETESVTGGMTGAKVQSKNEVDINLDISKSINQILKPMFMKLSDEVNRALIYAASETRGEPVKHVYLLGSVARWQGADKMLNLLVNIPVSIPNPLLMFGNTEEKDNIQKSEGASEIAVATGLALRGVLCE